jgi:cytochrome c-type biogenesis protein CcmH/NrfG
MLAQIQQNGEILSETTYQLNLSRKEERRNEKSLLLRAISDKKRELEREQRALVARTMDKITKMEKVLKVKVSFVLFLAMLFLCFLSYTLQCTFFRQLVLFILLT